MVARAQRSRAPIQRLADRVAGWFVPAVIAVALAAFAAWALFGPEPRFAYALVAAVTVLIIACPCALGLATPMSIMVGVGRGARSGILIRDADALQRLETRRHAGDRQDRHADRRQAEGRGRPCGARRSTRLTLLRLAASVERASEHPLARCDRRRGEGARASALADVRDFEFAGRQGRARHRWTAATSWSAMPPILTSCGIDAPELCRPRRERSASTAQPSSSSASTSAPAGADRHRRSDQGRPPPRRCRRCRTTVIRLVMLTGDNATTAQAVARQLGIDEVEAEALPEQKSAVVERLRARRPQGCDGRRRRQRCARTCRRRRRHRHGRRHRRRDRERRRHAAARRPDGQLSRRAICRVRRCATSARTSVFAFVYNAAGVPIAAGVLYPVFGILLSPMIGAAAMALSSVSVIANALRLARVKTLDCGQSRYLE